MSLPAGIFFPLCVKACAIPLTAVVCVCNGKTQGFELGQEDSGRNEGKSSRTDVIEKEQTEVY